VFAIGQSTALTVPTPSIVVRDGSNFVFVIDEASKASARRVQTGRRVGERVEIVDGLRGSERVAVQGAGFLNEGDLVKVVK
jgi:multidrug efflux pump subunit AcrA (membrane-fusion protein)